MSQEESEHSTVEFRDGQLQIVEVTPFERSSDEDIEVAVQGEGNSDGKFLKVYDSDNKLMQLDLLNLTLVRCEGEDGDEFRLVTHSESEVANEYLNNDSSTVTCVLQSSEGEEQDGKEYVMVDAENGEQMVDSNSYVIVEGEQGIMLLHSDPPPKKEKEEAPPPQTTYDALQRAKAIRKAKRLIAESLRPQRGRGRRRKYEMPDAQELLSSPQFKLFLYSCKMCSFKCNAVRELTEHRSQEHGSGSTGGARGQSRGASSLLQCPRCPFRATTHYQLMKHAQQMHQKSQGQPPHDPIAEAAPDSVLVCGACGFESPSRPDFREHITEAHSNMVAEEFITGDID